MIEVQLLSTYLTQLLIIDIAGCDDGDTVASKKTDHQNHALTQWKMLYCKTVLNHHVV
jgi:hypothetical protein